MKITKRNQQLRKILNETVSKIVEAADDTIDAAGVMGGLKPRGNGHFDDSLAGSFTDQARDEDMAEYTRGEQDGFAGKEKDNSSESMSYDAGYESGIQGADTDYASPATMYRDIDEGTEVKDMPPGWKQALGGCLD